MWPGGAVWGAPMGVVVALLLSLQDWSPRRGFDGAAHDFFSTSTAERLGVELRLSDDVDLAVYPKLPFAEGRGRWRGESIDIALAGVLRFDGFRFELGASLPFVPDEILARETDVDVAAIAFAGAGVAWEVGDAVALGVQVELNSSAFGEAELLRRHPASVTCGLRAAWGALTLEGGFGVGIDRLEGWPHMAYVGLTLRF